MPDKKKETEENENGGEPQDEAKLKLVNAIVDPTDEQLPSLTVIPRVLAVPLAIMQTYPKALDPDRDKMKEPLGVIFLRNLLKLQRSVNARVLERTVTLALEQIGAEAEEEEEEPGDND